jgi:outer membrane lipoprotein-sorting protein
MKTDSMKLTAILGLIMVGLFLAGCGESRTQFAGTYKSVDTYAGKGNITLNLMEDGRGTWALGGKTVEFTWVVNTGKIFIYTKPGAILIITPSEGGNILSADMTGEWHPGCPANACLVFRRVPEGGQQH